MKNNEKGYALLITILSIVFISIIGLSLFTLTTSSHSQTTNERKDQSIFYIAEAGLNIKEAKIKQLIETAYNEAKAYANIFESKFNEKLTAILSAEAYTVYDKTYFNTNYNGDPSAIVTIELREPSNIRKFTIISKGFINGTTKERTVEKTFTIPNELVLVNITQQPVFTPGSSIPNPTAMPGPVIDNLNIIKDEAKNYMTGRIQFVEISKDRFNMSTHTNFAKTKDNTKLGSDLIYKNSDKVFFQNGYKHKEPVMLAHPNFSYSYNIKGQLNATSNNQTITEDLTMPNLADNKTSVFNLIVQGNNTIVFDKSFTMYDLHNIRFNVTGGGTLNLVFKDAFNVNPSYKFVIDTKGTATKVNIIFEKHAHISGELYAQNIYTFNNSSTIRELTAIAGATIIADNIYVNNGNFVTNSNSKVKANLISINKGHVRMESNSTIFANNIQLTEGNIGMSGALYRESKILANTISLLKGNISAPTLTCIRSNEIFIKSGELHSAGKLNYRALYADKFEFYSPINVNKNLGDCFNSNSSSVTITPPPDNPGQQYIDVFTYSYLHDENFLNEQPIIELN